MILFLVLIFPKMVPLVSESKIQVRNLRIVSVKILVTTCDESKCSIFSAYDMSYQDITLPTLEEGQKIEKVFHGRGNSSHLLAVKHSTGFFIW